MPLGLDLDVDPRVGGLAGDVGELLRSVTVTASTASSARLGRRPRSGSPGMGSTSTMPGPGLHDPGEEREVLAQRVALELARQVEVARPGWPSKMMPNISQRLALVPVGARRRRWIHVSTRRSSSGRSAWKCTPHPLGRRRRRGRAAGSGCRHRRARVDELGARATVSCSLVDAGGVLVPAVRRRQPVDGREEVEEREAQRAARPRLPARQASRGDPDPQVATGYEVRLDQRVAELLGERRPARLPQLVGRGWLPASTARPRSGRSAARSVLRWSTGGSADDNRITLASGRPGPRSGCAAGGARCPRAGPRAGAGSRARTRRRG